MTYDFPPIPLDSIVTVETIGEHFPDTITVYHVCGETVYVGPKVPNYVVMPGTSCFILSEKMEKAS